MNRFGQFRRGRGVRRLPGQMNGTEKDYALHLQFRQERGEIIAYTFDAVKLRLAENTFYTPDFLVQLADLTLEIHEVKGHWEDDARCKIKVAAALFPFRFVAATKKRKKDGGGWAFEDFAHEAPALGAA